MIFMLKFTCAGIDFKTQVCFCASPLFGSIGVSARLSIYKTSLLFLAHSLLLAVFKTEQCADFHKSNYIVYEQESAEHVFKMLSCKPFFFAFCILTDLLALTAATGQNDLHRRCKFLKFLNQPTADSDQRGRQSSEPRSN